MLDREPDEHVLRQIVGLRVVADSSALDGAKWSGTRDPMGRDTETIVVLRIAPDEALGIDARHIELDDPDAVVVTETGFVAGWCNVVGLMAHVEWDLPDEPGSLAQGALAGVPVKVWVADDEDNLLVVTHAAYADELRKRLGWHG